MCKTRRTLSLLGLLLAIGSEALTGCRSVEKKKTTLEVQTPKSERKITIESTRETDDEDKPPDANR